MSNPLVSVIIPTYNCATLVREALESALRQSYREIEVIVIDDGSTDDTAALMQSYGSRIRYSRRPHAGVNAARNVGIKMAKGQFLALLDSDDLWQPYKIELQVALLKKFSDVSFTFSNFSIFHGATPETGACRSDGLATWFEQMPAKRDPYRWRQQFGSLGLALSAALPRDFTVSGGDIYGASLFCPYVLPSTALIRASALASGLRFQEFDPTCGAWEFFSRLSKERGCVYADLETTFERGDQDAAQPTRIEPGLQLGRRIAMVDRLWRADRPFYANFGDEVDELQHRLLLQAAREQLLSGRGGQARATLKRARMLRADPSMQESVLRAVAGIPGSGLLLMALRAAVQGMRRLAARE